MKNQPLISVIMSVFNREKYVKESIESILQQSNQNFEYLIVDDGSTDNTSNILKRYATKDSHIVLIEKKHSGLADSLNVGLRQAKGEWIARLDADDIAVPDRLSSQWNFVRNNRDIVLLGGGCIEIDKNATTIKEHIYPQNHNALIRRLENGKAFFPHSSAFFNKEYIMNLGGYNNKFLRSQDCDLWLRVGENALISCLKTPVVKLRKHSQMISIADRGKLQLVMGISAIVCHFRRKWNLLDPSQLGERVWKEFLEWIEIRMEAEGFFRLMQGWQEFRNSWYSDIKENKFKKYKSALIELAKNPLAKKALWRRFQKDNIVLKLAEESKRLHYLYPYNGIDLTSDNKYQKK